jgi:hypothetical protein
MSDYAIILDEKKLWEEEILGKIQHLAFAQRVMMMMDHPAPESLFVEAFLYEAVQAFKS